MKNIEAEIINYLQENIRTIPDFPKAGIQFKDITPLLKNRNALAYTAQLLVTPFLDTHVDVVVGLESRGFMFGTAMALKLNAGFVPVRKPNKLPAEKIHAEYELEYGTDKVEIHKDAIFKGAKVVIHDDLIATGGTATAATQLVEALGGEIIGYSFIIELGFLGGKQKLKENIPVHSLIVLE